MKIECASCGKPNEINVDLDYPFRLFMCESCKRTNKVKYLMSGPIVTLLDISSYLELKSEISRIKFVINAPEFIPIALEEEFADWEFAVTIAHADKLDDWEFAVTIAHADKLDLTSDTVYAFKTKAKNIPNAPPSIYKIAFSHEQIESLKKWPIIFYAGVKGNIISIPELNNCKTYREALEIMYEKYKYSNIV